MILTIIAIVLLVLGISTGVMHKNNKPELLFESVTPVAEITLTEFKDRYELWIQGEFSYPVAGLARLSNIVSTLDKTKVMTIKVSSYGGAITTGLSLLDIIESHGNSVYLVETTNFSMGGVVACAADKVIIKDDGFLMFHPVSGGAPDQMLVANHHMRTTLLKKCVDKGILTATEARISTSIGGEVYIYENGAYYILPNGKIKTLTHAERFLYDLVDDAKGAL